MPPESTWNISAEAYHAMVRRAEADYPEETCGLVYGADTALEVVPIRNIQNELHARDPEHHTRDARRAYYFDPGELNRVLQEKEAQGVSLRAIYHSHPDEDAYFSEKDRADAAPPELGEPLYGDCVYLIFSVRRARVVDLKGFAWSDAAADFVAIGLTYPEA